VFPYFYSMRLRLSIFCSSPTSLDVACFGILAGTPFIHFLSIQNLVVLHVLQYTPYDVMPFTTALQQLEQNPGSVVDVIGLVTNFFGLGLFLLKGVVQKLREDGTGLIWAVEGAR
jgi:hypothetical protein